MFAYFKQIIISYLYFNNISCTFCYYHFYTLESGSIFLSIRQSYHVSCNSVALGQKLKIKQNWYLTLKQPQKSNINDGIQYLLKNWYHFIYFEQIDSSQSQKQSTPKSSSSSGFQQFIIEDESKNGNTKLEIRQDVLIEKSKFKQNQLMRGQTMIFGQDLNSSISYRPAVNFCFGTKQISQQNALYQQQENETNKEKLQKIVWQIPSDLDCNTKSNYESFSDLNQLSSQSFSDLNISGKQLKILSDSLDQKPSNEPGLQNQQNIERAEFIFDFWGMEQSKKNLTKTQESKDLPRKISDSFENLNQNNQRPTKNQKSINLLEFSGQYNTQNHKISSPDVFSKGPSAHEQIVDLTDISKSMIFQTNDALDYPLLDDKAIESSEKQLKQAFKKSSIKANIETPKNLADQLIAQKKINHYEQQFQMQSPQSQTEKMAKIQQQQTKKLFQIYVTDSVYFIKLGQQESRKLSQELFEGIIEHFLSKKVMLPLLSHKIGEDLSQSPEQKQQLQQQLLKLYLNLGFQFLIQKYPKQIHQYFDLQLKQPKFISGFSKKKEDSPAVFGNIFKKIYSYLPFHYKSKTEILKKTLISQLAFLIEFKQHWLFIEEQSTNQIKKEEKKSMPQLNVTQPNAAQSILTQSNLVKLNQSQLLKNIAKLELLISFQKSEMYCDQKLKEKLQQNLWKEIKQKLVEDRNWIITNMFPKLFL